MPLTLPNTDLAVHVTGRPGGPTLLLLHGFAGSAHGWPDAVRRWAEDHRVVTVDARGHGDSPRWSEERLAGDPWQGFVDDVVTLLDDLATAGVDRPVLVGHSMGAGTAAAAAVRRPGLVRALVLEDPPWEAVPAGPDAGQRAAYAASFESFRRDPSARIAQQRRERPGWPESELAPWVMGKVHAQPAMVASTRMRPDPAWRDTVAALRVPTLVVTGDREDEVMVGPATRAVLDDLANPHVRVEVVPGGSHNVRLDVPEAFHDVVDPFIAKAFA